jgi:6-phosphogluconolactonase/glucosamine-6-phosphate isomerase/deaminase
MRFVSITDPQPVVDYLINALASHLDKGESVLWLIPGGSALTVAAAVSRQLQGRDLSKLHVTLTDERYGAVGHPDSNWQQLSEAGFQVPGASVYPVLSGTDRAGTTAAFADYMERQLQTIDFKLGLFGIGPDGHTAGVLPNSPAVSDSRLAATYDAGNYQRITLTPPAISRLDEAVVYAMGADKKPALEALQTSVPLAEQPAQVLKQVPKLTIFTDQYNQKES